VEVGPNDGAVVVGDTLGDALGANVPHRLNVPRTCSWIILSNEAAIVAHDSVPNPANIASLLPKTEV
jgi:hypothetical protein